MKKLIYSFITVVMMLVVYHSALAQGCVAIRHFSSCGNTSGGGHMFLLPGEWSLNTNYRYFRSFRHFRGNEEEPERIANNTEVINWQHALDISLSYPLTSRLTANFTLPLVYNERSSLYEHGGSERHLTTAYGLSDIRLGVSYWLLDPYSNSRGNIMVGLGVRFPTGNPAAEDRFYNVGPMGSSEIRPVDQSIQPGDGGVGITAEVQIVRQLTNSIALLANGFYLMNPRETNGTKSYIGHEGEDFMSVADQYALRGGASFLLPVDGFSAFIGGRFEAVPARDLIGGNMGFRRPGYIWSIEPGISFSRSNITLRLNVPVALDRARPQSAPEQRIERLTGRHFNGDAAFADYLINFDITWRFGKPKSKVQTFY